MKKQMIITALILASVLSFTACGRNNTENPAADENAESTVVENTVYESGSTSDSEGEQSTDASEPKTESSVSVTTSSETPGNPSSEPQSSVSDKNTSAVFQVSSEKEVIINDDFSESRELSPSSQNSVVKESSRRTSYTESDVKQDSSKQREVSKGQSEIGKAQASQTSGSNTNKESSTESSKSQTSKKPLESSQQSSFVREPSKSSQTSQSSTGSALDRIPLEDNETPIIPAL